MAATMMSATGRNIDYKQLANSLPAPLKSFLSRHPPGTFHRATTPPTPAETARRVGGELATTSLPSRTRFFSLPENVSRTNPASTPAQLATVKALHAAANPFLPWRNPHTDRWRPPVYSPREQKLLYNLAREHGVMSLLPEGPKHPRVLEERKVEGGLKVKGTGLGQKVKGKAWERHLRAKQEMRRKAMERMPELIREWKTRGHGRGWKKWPK